MSDGLSSEELLPRIGDSVTRIHLSLSLLKVLISWSCMRCSFVFDDLYRWTQKFVHVGGLGRIFSILKELSQECRYCDKVRSSYARDVLNTCQILCRDEQDEQVGTLINEYLRGVRVVMNSPVGLTEVLTNQDIEGLRSIALVCRRLQSGVRV